MNLSPTASRAAALAVLALVIFAMFTYVIFPLFNAYADRHSEIASLNDRLLRYQQLLATEPAIVEQTAAIEELDAERDIFLKGKNSAIASANLRELVTDAVKATGGELVSSEGYGAASTPSSIPIGLELRISAEVRSLIDLLHTLESSSPLIFVDDLQISSSASRTGVSRAERRNRSAANINHSLSIKLNIVSYLPGVES